MAFTIFSPYLLFGFTFLRHTCKEQICANPFFRPVRDSTPTWRRRRDLNQDHIRWKESALITAPPMFIKKRVKDANKIYCRAPTWNRNAAYQEPITGLWVPVLTSSPLAFCHVIYYTNHLTKLQATSLDKDSEMRSKDCVCFKSLIYP